MILDAECMRPIHTVCNMVEPSKECQLVLRHFFNDSGIYCINVSMANDVSLASTSAKVRFDPGNWPHSRAAVSCFMLPSMYTFMALMLVLGSGLSSPGTMAAVIGVLVFIMVIGVVAYSYK